MRKLISLSPFDPLRKTWHSPSTDHTVGLGIVCVMRVTHRLPGASFRGYLGASCPHSLHVRLQAGAAKPTLWAFVCPTFEKAKQLAATQLQITKCQLCLSFYQCGCPGRPIVSQKTSSTRPFPLTCLFLEGPLRNGDRGPALCLCDYLSPGCHSEWARPALPLPEA